MSHSSDSDGENRSPAVTDCPGIRGKASKSVRVEQVETLTIAVTALNKTCLELEAELEAIRAAALRVVEAKTARAIADLAKLVRP